MNSIYLVFFGGTRLQKFFKIGAVKYFAILTGKHLC